MTFSRDESALVQVTGNNLQNYADHRITTCREGYSALKKIKLAGALNAATFSKLNEVIEDFYIEISPVTDNLVRVLNALAEMSDNINAHMYFGNIVVNSLILAKSLTDKTVNARQYKLLVLQKAIECANQFAKNPLSKDSLASLGDAVAEMNKTIDTQFYFFRAENTTVSVITAVAGAAGSSVMFVGGILLCPFNSALAIISLLAASMLFSTSATLAINLIRPIELQDYNISVQTLQLKKSFIQLQKPNPLLTQTNNSRARLVSMALLEKDESRLFGQKESECLTRYANYINIIEALIPLSGVDENTRLWKFEKLYTDEIYENVNTKYYSEFMTAMESLKNLNDIIIKLESAQAYLPIILPPLKQMFQYSLQLTAEIALESYDYKFRSTRKDKLVALNETIKAAIDLSSTPLDTMKATKLSIATTAMHHTISGHYLMRKENRLITGVIGAALTLLSIAAMVGSLALLCMLVPATAPLTFIAIGIALTTTFSATASASIYMLASSFDSHRPKEDISKKICQQSVVVQSLFRPRNTETLRTTLLESNQPQLARERSTM
jgi:hypothetical protein